MLRIALPKGKSLEVGTCELFRESRIKILRNSGSHSVRFSDFDPLSTGVFVKPKRVPLLVAKEKFDVGIIGEDVILESGVDVETCTTLSFNKSTTGVTRGVLFVHKDDDIVSVQDIPAGAVILSEYPNITRQFFAKLKKIVQVIESPGSVEAEVPYIFRFGVVLSETGSSLRANNLRVLAEVFQSRTVLIANISALQCKAKNEAVTILKTILAGTVAAREKVMLAMNVCEDNLQMLLGILPSLGSPTVAGLVKDSWFSVSVVVPKTLVNSLIAQLLQIKVEGIVVMPIHSVV